MSDSLLRRTRNLHSRPYCRPHLRSMLRLCLLLALASANGALAQEALRADIEAFIADMAAKYDYDPVALRAVFSKAQTRPNILRAMTAPSTARPWYEFRPRYVENRRIEGGVRFWAENGAALARARARFGVPEEIVVATIGVETLYGRQVGGVKVLDALTTLAFDYPRRADFFRGELEAYLLLGRELAWDVTAVRGSYAGAMGLPQFLPSSYRKYAVDFDSDGMRNLWGDPADAIGSVANYYSSHGWERDAVATVPVVVDEASLAQLDTTSILPERPVADFIRDGVTPLASAPVDAKAALIMLETEAGPRYWLALQNFYVITRYNRSVNYAMAVYELAGEIRARMKGEATAIGER